jgi:hypothetical protein
MSAEQVRKVSRLHNAKVIASESPVKRVLVNGLHIAVVNTLAALSSEVLNFYLENRGLNQRRVAISMIPNPDKPAPVNPLRKVTGGSF